MNVKPVFHHGVHRVHGVKPSAQNDKLESRKVKCFFLPPCTLCTPW